jgi:hypothetical protein
MPFSVQTLIHSPFFTYPVRENLSSSSFIKLIHLLVFISTGLSIPLHEPTLLLVFISTGPSIPLHGPTLLLIAPFLIVFLFH